jgi:hypothetical protein
VTPGEAGMCDAQGRAGMSVTPGRAMQGEQDLPAMGGGDHISHADEGGKNAQNHQVLR